MLESGGAHPAAAAHLGQRPNETERPGVFGREPAAHAVRTLGLRIAPSSDNQPVHFEAAAELQQQWRKAGRIVSSDVSDELTHALDPDGVTVRRIVGPASQGEPNPGPFAIRFLRSGDATDGVPSVALADDVQLVQLVQADLVGNPGLSQQLLGLGV